MANYLVRQTHCSFDTDRGCSDESAPDMFVSNDDKYSLVENFEEYRSSKKEDIEDGPLERDHERSHWVYFKVTILTDKEAEEANEIIEKFQELKRK